MQATLLGGIALHDRRPFDIEAVIVGFMLSTAHSRNVRCQRQTICKVLADKRLQYTRTTPAMVEHSNVGSQISSSVDKVISSFRNRLP